MTELGGVVVVVVITSINPFHRYVWPGYLPPVLITPFWGK